jgi:hypothetical protein
MERIWGLVPAAVGVGIWIKLLDGDELRADVPTRL